MPPNPNRQVGLGVYMAYGVEAAAGPPEEPLAISWRHQLLSCVVERGVLDDYKHGEELDEKFFDVAATMPCDKEDLAETMLPTLLAQLPPELSAKAREAIRAAGYDTTKPNIDRKSLDFLRKNAESTG